MFELGTSKKVRTPLFWETLFSLMISKYPQDTFIILKGQVQPMKNPCELHYSLFHQLSSLCPASKSTLVYTKKQKELVSSSQALSAFILTFLQGELRFLAESFVQTKQEVNQWGTSMGMLGMRKVCGGF